VHRSIQLKQRAKHNIALQGNKADISENKLYVLGSIVPLGSSVNMDPWDSRTGLSEAEVWNVHQRACLTGVSHV
jgi:hypothetical protein